MKMNCGGDIRELELRGQAARVSCSCRYCVECPVFTRECK